MSTYDHRANFVRRSSLLGSIVVPGTPPNPQPARSPAGAIAIIVGTIVLVVVFLGVGWVIGGIGDGSVR